MAGINLLTSVALKQWNPELGKESKLNDGGGLNLVASRAGTKTWRFRYRVIEAGTEKRIERNYTIGEFPGVSLKEAREARARLQEEVKAGKDPWLVQKRQGGRAPSEVMTLRKMATIYNEQHLSTTSAGNQKRTWGQFSKWALPVLGDWPLADIRPRDIRQVTDPILAQGMTDTARRVVQTMAKIYQWGAALEHCENNPAEAFKVLLPKHVQQHYAALLDWKEIRRFMRALDKLKGAPQTVLMCRLFPHVALRPVNVFGMRREWINFPSRQVDFPASAMKGDEQGGKKPAPHILPMSTQVRAILTEALEVNDGSQWVFPTPEDGADQPLSGGTAKTAFLRMGFTPDTCHPHGWRATFRTLSVEVLNHRPDLAEHCIAHKVLWANGRAYDRTEFLPQRRIMMQEWSDFLFWLKDASDKAIDEKLERMADDPQELLI